MKKYFVFFAYLFMVVSLTILFAIVHSTFFPRKLFAQEVYVQTSLAASSAKKVNTCDVYFATQDFVVFIQDKSQDNPSKFASKKEEFRKLAEEIEELTAKGDSQGICNKYREFKVKF